jgi:D-glycero-alpha-D-manno-heptose-7-phosphate kinase
VIISRTPLRISLFGGGTDIDPYLSLYGSEILSFTINKYIYISAHPLVESNNILLKYSKNENVTKASQISHPVFRAVLEKFNLSSIDISVSSDIPAGTGMGSSSAFTVGLLSTLRNYSKMVSTPDVIAREACEIEINTLNEPIGIQDQFACAYGGLNLMNMESIYKTSIIPIALTNQMSDSLVCNFILIRIPGSRSAGSLLKEQKAFAKDETLHKIKSLVQDGVAAFNDSPKSLGELLDYSWNLKKQLSPFISGSSLDSFYSSLLLEGFYGGKLLGAGGSGYLLMVGPENVVNKAKQRYKESILEFAIENEGCKIIYNSSWN